MLWLVSAVALLLILAMAKTRDNILAAVSLTFLGVAVAGAVWLLDPALSAAFILITLVYVVAALTLVIVAAASLSEEGRAVEMRPVALASLAALPLVLMPGAEQRAIAASVDPLVVPLAAVLLLFSFVVAARLSHD
jgi:NADH:ubiquinone oxidoreductase subunit 6 (subunit J)